MIPRTGSDLSERIPVIVHIADFQLTENAGPFNRTNPYEPYWSTSMRRQADLFHDAYPNGIYLTVRLDHNGNKNFMYEGITYDFTTSTYDNLMKTNVTRADRGYGFTPVAYGTSYATALGNVKNDFLSYVSTTNPQGAIITDVVPLGLENVRNISHKGTYNPANRTITWDLSDYPVGETTVSFDTTVTSEERYENFANITHYDDHKEKTNTTYHELGGESDMKNASVNGEPVDNGDEDNPVAVKTNDEITYTITADNRMKGSGGPPKYDVLFVLNWSQTIRDCKGSYRNTSR